ncbi:hypothetical protein QFC19_009012 [Naganishia cerealis]|uniref:Uncharacterized protein n=1 Tax=Naganishia cerealis TaxID=610337 RepID=A0ACC2UXG2_9TREE|nr:hypothetical protein QFC19_009012 [Naganishia cerealis]
MPAPLLTMVVAKYLHSAHPQDTLDAPGLLASLPDLRDVVDEYQSLLLAQQLRGASLAADAAAAEQGATKQPSLKDLVNSPVNPRAREVLLASGVRKTLDTISTAGFLSVRCEKIAKREFDTQSAEYRVQYPERIVVTATDRTVKTVDLETGEVDQLLEPHKAAVLCTAIHPTRRRYLLTSSMDSTAILTDLITQRTLQSFRHGKFVVRCAFSPDAGRWVGTASYDKTIRIYEDLGWVPATESPVRDTVDTDWVVEEGNVNNDDPELAEEPTLRYTLRHTLTLAENPESLLFTPDVLNVVPDPSGRMIACQTGDHAGGTGERVLLYDINLPSADDSTITLGETREDPEADGLMTFAQRTRGSLAPGMEDNPRLSVIWTGDEGDPYVLPRLAWLPDSSGIITTTTTGELVLHSLRGETVARLKAHGGGTSSVADNRVGGTAGTSAVIKDLCIVGAKDDVDSWRVVSVGYDATIRIS